jgi:hypothetical protein
MATVNQVGNSLTGSTGSGSFVGSNSPTLVTPTLGVITATSINFGGSTLSSYVATTAFTPTFTCATVGNLSVSYATQSAFYSRVGNVVDYNIRLICTPTFTTASGQIYVDGLPFTINASSGDYASTCTQIGSFIYPVGVTQLVGQCTANTTQIWLYGFGSSTAATAIQMSNIVSGVAFSILYTGFYFV